MKITFLDEAAKEYAAAVDYYERREPGLGQPFEDELSWALQWLLEHPHAFALRRGAYRRMNLHIFPYYIAYVIREPLLWIVAVAHAQRRPEFWVKRARHIEDFSE